MDIEKLKKEIKKYFSENFSHSFDHTERVYNLAMSIAKKEKADLEIVEVAALLHDIAREKEDKKECECHAETGAEMTKKILENSDFPKEKIESVCYAIQVHRKSKKIKPETKEAEILQDADRLDALGAVDIARVVAASVEGKYRRPVFSKEKGNKETSVIHYLQHKLETLKPEAFNTKTGKLIAKQRYDFMKLYVDTFIKEWDGAI